MTDADAATVPSPPTWIPIVPPGPVLLPWDDDDPRPRMRVSDPAALAARSLARFGSLPVDYNPQIEAGFGSPAPAAGWLDRDAVLTAAAGAIPISQALLPAMTGGAGGGTIDGVGGASGDVDRLTAAERRVVDLTGIDAAAFAAMASRAGMTGGSGQ